MTSDADVSLEQESETSAVLAPEAIVSDRYRIIEVLGRGGMGIVYKAEHIHMNRIVAMKMLLEKHAVDSQNYLRFKREAQSVSQLDHPNIVGIHDFGFDKGRAYLCMDFLIGTDLDEVITKAPLTLMEFKHIFLQACGALQHAHEKGIVHRDLKPSNIMITEKRGDKQHVIIVDFGLVKMTQSSDNHKLTATNMVVGSPLYMSPEQCQAKEVDARSDIYSLACVMYESITGCLPIVANSVYELMKAQISEPPTPIKEAAPELEIPQALDDLIMQMLNKNVNDRPQSMQEIAERMNEAFEVAFVESASHAGVSQKNAQEDAAGGSSAIPNTTGTENSSEQVTVECLDGRAGDEILRADRDAMRASIADSEELLSPVVERTLVGEDIDNNFKVLEVIGKGGMSVVYKALYKVLNKTVAIKTMHPHLVSDVNALQRFKQEAQAASQLDHPNVIKIYSFGVISGAQAQPYIVMDYLDGVSLSETSKHDSSLPIQTVLKIFIQICSALSHAHNKGVVHRDLKPSNIMLIKLEDDPYFVKIVDFGIAKLLPQDGEQAHRLTQTGDIFGSPTYMSPEQCMGKVADKRSDVYSLGCVLYETLSGKPPHNGESIFELFGKHINEIPASMSIPGADQTLVDRLDAIIFRALEKDPSKRYQSMAAFESDLKSLQSDLEAGLKGRDLLLGIARHQRSVMRFAKASPKVVLFFLPMALIMTLWGAISWSKCSWFFEPHEFRTPATHWMDYLPSRHRMRPPMSIAKKQSLLDKGLTIVKLVESSAGRRSPQLLSQLRERARFCGELDAPDEEYSALKKAVNIQNEMGMTNNLEYAEDCANLGECLITQGNNKEAYELLQKSEVIRKDSDFHESRVFLDLGYLSFKLGKQDAAIDYLNKALNELQAHKGAHIADYRQSAIVYAVLGDVYRWKGNWAECGQDYAEAERLNASSMRHKNATKMSGDLDIVRGYVSLQQANYPQANSFYAASMPYARTQYGNHPIEFPEILDAYAFSAWKSGDFLMAIQTRDQSINLANADSAKRETGEHAPPSTQRLRRSQ